MELSHETDIDSTDIDSKDEEFKLEDLVIQVEDISDIFQEILDGNVSKRTLSMFVLSILR